MASAAERPLIPYNHVEQLRSGREILRAEGEALLSLANCLDSDFCAALQLIEDCTGSLIVTGMGKAGLIGRKITATLSSTGTRAHFLHPAEAVHGDLGCLHANDLLLALSNSGETEELCRLLPMIKRLQIPVIALTSSRTSRLASYASAVLELGDLQEVGGHGLAPSTSTTAMLAVGDALALVASQMKGFGPEQFALFHPGGSLGAQLKRVDEVMRKPNELCIANAGATIRDVLRQRETENRRTGVILLINTLGVLSGLFTDSDLVRLLEQRRDSQLDRPIQEVMTHSPITISPGMLLQEAVAILSEKKISELPVVDANKHPVGLIDITDIISLSPPKETTSQTIMPFPVSEN